MPKRGRRKLLASEAVDVDDRLCERLRRFLRQIVPDAARHGPMRILAREFLGIGAAVRMWRTICIAFEGNGGHAYERALGQPLFQIVVSGLAFNEREPPPTVMDHDGDVIWIIEGRRTAIERRIVKLPLGRGKLPDELR